MPQETDNLILIKRSNVSGATPTLNSLKLGELGINTADGKLFTTTELNSVSSVKTFLNSEDYPYTLNHYYSSVNFKYGNNTVNQIFAGVLGGYNNDISGGGSTVINGENNDIAGDFCFIGSGVNNKILATGDYSVILGGSNNLISHENTFTIGSNLSSHANNFTYVNNISAQGIMYGNGSGLTNLAVAVAPDTEVRALTADWKSTYTTVQSNSATKWDNSLANQYTRTNFLPLSGGTLTGTFISDVSATGSFYGDGSKLTGIVAGDTTATTLVRSNSANWQTTYSTVSSLSGYWTQFQPNPNYIVAENQAKAITSGWGEFYRQSSDVYTQGGWWNGGGNALVFNAVGYVGGSVANKWALINDDGENGSTLYATATTTGGTYPWNVSYDSGLVVTREAAARIINPLSGIAFEGTSVYAARADHVHPFPTALQVGAAPLASGKIPAQYLPSYVDDVVEYATLAALQADTTNGRYIGKIYVVLSTNETYRWSGSTHILISNPLVLEDLQIPDSMVGIQFQFSSPSTVTLSVEGITNGRNHYGYGDGSEFWSVFWTGTQWKGTWSYRGDGDLSDETFATGNTTYPWQATWSNASVARIGTYNAALAPAPLGPIAYSGYGTKAARVDHVHPYPTALQVSAVSLTEFNSLSSKWQSAYTTVQSNSANWQNTYTSYAANSASFFNIVLTLDPLKFVFIGDSTTKNFTVSGTSNSTNASVLEVFVDSVRQEPTLSYTLSADIVRFVNAPSLNSRIVIITPNSTTSQLNVIKKHDFVQETTYSISYAGVASLGVLDSSPSWRITKTTFTDNGSVSATGYKYDSAWSDRLILNYNY